MTGTDVVLVTGSGGGMGLAVASRLAAEPGTGTLVVNDRRPELVAAAVTELKAGHAVVAGRVADATRPEAVDDLVGSVLAEFGWIDVLVTVVGGIPGPVTTDFWDITDHDWDATLRVNLSSTFYAVRAVARSMRERGSGRVVTVSSVAWGGDAARAHYAAAKAGVVALTRSASDALAPHGITVNAVAPGRTNSGFGGRTDVDAALPDVLPPTGRRNEPEDVAEAVAYLASPAARQVSGQLIVVAGGRNPSL